MKQFVQLLLIHFREFYREPAVLFWALFFPAALAIVLGFAFRTPAETVVEVGIAMSDPSMTRERDRLIHRLENTGGFRVQLHDEITAEHALKRGKIRVLVVVDGDRLIFRYDPASDSAMKEQAILRSTLLTEELNTKDRSLEITDQTLKLPGTRYVDYLIPGLLAFGVMNACVWGIGWSLISLRMKMLLRLMAASPMDQNLFFLSFATARIALVTIEATFLMLSAYLFFDLWPVGSLFTLFIVLIAGIFCFAGLAVVISCRTANTQVGNGLINAAVMPMMLVSGVFFSYHGFPDFIQPFIKALPLTVLADSVRAVYLEGAGLADVWGALLILIGSGSVLFLVGRRFFRWS